MNKQSKLDQFRSDNPYDVQTQAKRLLAADEPELILYVLELGLLAAKHRQRHEEREYMKNVGEPPGQRLVPGRVTGSVKIVQSRKFQNFAKQFILDVWRVGEIKLGDATGNDLAVAIERENASSNGHQKNAQFYAALKAKVGNAEAVRMQWNETKTKAEIERIYGEFRRQEAA